MEYINDPSALRIREASLHDFDAIMHINLQAFGAEDEALLVAKLIDDPSAQPVLSMIAVYRGKTVGHILFSRAGIDGQEDISTYLLAPMAVLPDYQRMGIGGRLIGDGQKILKTMGVELVFVLGHPGYYPRFEFIPDAGRYGFEAPFPILPSNADAWMYKTLSDKKLQNVSGKVICCDAFNRPEYWKE